MSVLSEVLSSLVPLLEQSSESVFKIYVTTINFAILLVSNISI